MAAISVTLLLATSQRKISSGSRAKIKMGVQLFCAPDRRARSPLQVGRAKTELGM